MTLISQSREKLTDSGCDDRLHPTLVFDLIFQFFQMSNAVETSKAAHCLCVNDSLFTRIVLL